MLCCMESNNCFDSKVMSFMISLCFTDLLLIVIYINIDNLDARLTIDDVLEDQLTIIPV